MTDKEKKQIEDIVNEAGEKLKELKVDYFISVHPEECGKQMLHVHANSIEIAVGMTELAKILPDDVHAIFIERLTENREKGETRIPDQEPPLPNGHEVAEG